MCDICEQEYGRWEGDISKRFRFEEAQLEYYDAPQAGWLRCIACERRFGFECEEILPGLLWHWALMPEGQVAKTSSPRETLEGARRQRDGYWVSIVEDRRAKALCSSARLKLATVVPPTLP
jgi:hypothetical protein